MLVAQDHVSVVGSYKSTVFTRSDPLKPPTAYTLSLSTARPALNMQLKEEKTVSKSHKSECTKEVALNTHRHRREGISDAVYHCSSLKS